MLPLASIAARLFDSLIAAVALAIALPFLGVHLSPALLWLPVLAFLLVTLTAASGLFLSCANLFFRDVKYIVQLLLTFGIFFTPVLIEPAMLGATGARLMMLNPLAPILEGVRLSLGGHGLLQAITEQAASGALIRLGALVSRLLRRLGDSRVPRLVADLPPARVHIRGVSVTSQTESPGSSSSTSGSASGE